MPSIASWCVVSRKIISVLENLEHCVKRRIYRDPKGHTAKSGSALSASELNTLRAA